MKWLRDLTLIVLLIGGCTATEVISHRRVNPAGHADKLDEYLAWRPTSAEFASVTVEGEECVIAYGPTSSWLLLSSGPSAYVFDSSGRLEAWSSDIGDDPEFDNRWSAQSSFGGKRSLTRGEVKKIAADQLEQ